MTVVGDRVLEALGPAFRKRAGDLLPDLVEGLIDPLAEIEERVRPVGRHGWPRVFDLDETPDPGWIGAATGSVVPRGLTIEEARAFVRDRPAFRRGTPGAITAAVKQLLTGSQRVDLYEREGSPWRMRIRTYQAQAAGRTQEQIRAAVLSQKPVGVVADVELASGASYAHVSAEHAPGTYEDFADTYPTYSDDLYLHVPEEGTEA